MDCTRRCSIAGCDRAGRLTRGLCTMHYKRWTRHGDPGEANRERALHVPGATCTIDECSGPVEAYGYCIRHYRRFQQYGDPTGSRHVTPDTERFFAKFSKDGPVSDFRPDLGPCWLWGSTLDPNGYGRVLLSDRRHHSAHRLAYQIFVGPIPDGLVIDHLCRVRCCVNPDHLETVTAVENTRRGFQARKAIRNNERQTA